MTYATCFDFPEVGEPWFGRGLLRELTSSIERASQFVSEDAAANYLKTFGDIAKWGVVVEVGE